MDTNTSPAPAAQAPAATPRPAADALRGLTAAGVLLSAVIHLDLWVQGMHRVDVVGPMFLLNAVGGIALGVVVLVWRHRLPLLGAVAFGAATLVAAVLATTGGGFFGVRESWENTIFLVSGVADLAAVVFGAAAWLALRPARPARP